jgi:hypothetical protein
MMMEMFYRAIETGRTSNRTATLRIKKTLLNYYRPPN